MMDADNCIHNQRCRYTHGFYCEDCETFFHRDSPTYRSGELLDSIWMVLNNVNGYHIKEGLPQDACLIAMIDEIGIGKKHDDYEDLIKRAEVIMLRHNVNSESAVLILEEDSDE